MSIEDPKQERKLFSEEALIQEFGLQMVKPVQPFELPADINLSGLEDLGVDEAQARDLAEAITKFKNLPIIIDQFDKDHTARREWRKRIEMQYGDNALSFLKTNKLRVNSFTFINFLFATIDLHTRKKQVPEVLLEKVNSIRTRYSEIVRGYEDMDIKEKIAVVQKLDQLFDEILELLKPLA